MIIEKPTITSSDEEIVIRTPTDIVSTLQKFYSNLQTKEHFSVAALNNAHIVQSLRVISVGTLSKTIIHPREVFRDAIIDNAEALILIHNHPSGNISPSKEDIETTRVLVEASKIIGIEILDHIILGNITDDFSLFYSMLEHGNVFEED